MGQRARHETILAIIGAFVKNRRWTQAELGRSVGVSTPAVRKHLLEMRAVGWPLTEDKQVGNVVWRMPAQWHPGVLAFDTSEVPDLVRAIARSPRDARQRRLLENIRKRIPLTTVAPTFEAAIRSPEIADAEQRWLDTLEDGAARKVAVKMHYFTASRRDADNRWVSVHHVETGPTARFVATCHRTNTLKWFSVTGISNAHLAKDVDFRDAKKDDVDRFVGETVAGFRVEGPPVKCSFVVRQPAAAWVKRNLVEGMKATTFDGGIRVTIDTAAVFKVAEFVVRLGRDATPETPELVRLVIQIAEGALESALASTTNSSRSPSTKR